jgi:hypothetical protein
MKKGIRSLNGYNWFSLEKLEGVSSNLMLMLSRRIPILSNEKFGRAFLCTNFDSIFHCDLEHMDIEMCQNGV